MTKKVAMAVGAIVAVAVAAGTVVGFAIRDESARTSAAHIEWVTGISSSTQLEVTYLAGGGSGCGDPYGVEVEESQKAVTLTAKIITRDIPSNGSRVCPAVGIATKRVVTLKSPLGTRQVLDRFQQANGEAGIVEVRVP